MMFCTLDTKYFLEQSGIAGLPADEHWNNPEKLSLKIIEYIFTSLDNPDLWSRFDILLELVMEDDEFLTFCKKSLGEYIGSEYFADSVINKLKNGEITWKKECVTFIHRIEAMGQHQINLHHNATQVNTYD